MASDNSTPKFVFDFVVEFTRDYNCQLNARLNIPTHRYIAGKTEDDVFNICIEDMLNPKEAYLNAILTKFTVLNLLELLKTKARCTEVHSVVQVKNLGFYTSMPKGFEISLINFNAESPLRCLPCRLIFSKKNQEEFYIRELATTLSNMTAALIHVEVLNLIYDPDDVQVPIVNDQVASSNDENKKCYEDDEEAYNPEYPEYLPGHFENKPKLPKPAHTIPVYIPGPPEYRRKDIHDIGEYIIALGSCKFTELVDAISIGNPMQCYHADEKGMHFQDTQLNDEKHLKLIHSCSMGLRCNLLPVFEKLGSGNPGFCGGVVLQHPINLSLLPKTQSPTISIAESQSVKPLNVKLTSRPTNIDGKDSGFDLQKGTEKKTGKSFRDSLGVKGVSHDKTQVKVDHPDILMEKLLTCKSIIDNHDPTEPCGGYCKHLAACAKSLLDTSIDLPFTSPIYCNKAGNITFAKKSAAENDYEFDECPTGTDINFIQAGKNPDGSKTTGKTPDSSGKEHKKYGNGRLKYDPNNKKGYQMYFDLDESDETSSYYQLVQIFGHLPIIDPEFKELIPMPESKKACKKPPPLEFYYLHELHHYLKSRYEGKKVKISLNMMDAFANMGKLELHDMWFMLDCFLSEEIICMKNKMAYFNRYDFRTSSALQLKLRRAALKYICLLYLHNVQDRLYEADPHSESIEMTTSEFVTFHIKYLQKTTKDKALAALMNDEQFEIAPGKWMPVFAFIYYCLRSGGYSDALDIAKKAYEQEKKKLGSHDHLCSIDYILGSRPPVESFLYYYQHYFHNYEQRMLPHEERECRLYYERHIANCNNAYRRIVFCLIARCCPDAAHPVILLTDDDRLFYRLSVLHNDDEIHKEEDEDVNNMYMIELQSKLYDPKKMTPAQQFRNLFVTYRFEEAIALMYSTPQFTVHCAPFALALLEAKLLLVHCDASGALLHFEEGETWPRLNLSHILLDYVLTFQKSSPVAMLEYLFFPCEFDSSAVGHKIVASGVCEYLLACKENEVPHIFGNGAHDASWKFGYLNGFHVHVPKFVEEACNLFDEWELPNMAQCFYQLVQINQYWMAKTVKKEAGQTVDSWIQAIEKTCMGGNLSDGVRHAIKLFCVAKKEYWAVQDKLLTMQIDQQPCTTTQALNLVRKEQKICPVSAENNLLFLTELGPEQTEPLDLRIPKRQLKVNKMAAEAASTSSDEYEDIDVEEEEDDKGSKKKKPRLEYNVSELHVEQRKKFKKVVDECQNILTIAVKQYKQTEKLENDPEASAEDHKKGTMTLDKLRRTADKCKLTLATAMKKFNIIPPLCHGPFSDEVIAQKECDELADTVLKYIEKQKWVDSKKAPKRK